MKFLSLADRNMKEVYRDPVSLLLGLLLPLGLLFLFSSIGKGSQIEIFTPAALTPGIIVLSYTFLLMFGAILLAKDKKSAFLIRLFTTPLKSSDFILAYTLPFIPLALFQTFVSFLAGLALGATFFNLFYATDHTIAGGNDLYQSGDFAGSLIYGKPGIGVGIGIGDL